MKVNLLRNRKAFLTHFVLLILAFLSVFPFIWMLFSSFKPADEIFTSQLRLLPQKWAIIENYIAVLRDSSVLRYMLNGVIVTLSIYILQIIVALPCSYALATLNFPGKKALFFMVLFCLLIPAQVTSIPVYLLLWKLKMLNSYAALIFPFTISVFGIFLFRQFFMRINKDLAAAARVDGMGEFEIMLRIFVPLLRPALVTFAIFSVVAHWNDYFWPLIAVQDSKLYTPPLGLNYFKGDGTIDYGPLMAAATVIILPLVAGFLAFQKLFIEGVGVQAGIK